MGCKHRWGEEGHSNYIFLHPDAHAHFHNLYSFDRNNSPIHMLSFVNLLWFPENKTNKKKRKKETELCIVLLWQRTNREKSDFWTGELQRQHYEFSLRWIMEIYDRLKRCVRLNTLSTEPQPWAVIATIIRPIIMPDGKEEKKDWERQRGWKTNVTPQGIHLQKLYNHKVHL